MDDYSNVKAENPEVGPHIHGHQIYEKVGTADIFSINSAEKTRYPWAMRRDNTWPLLQSKHENLFQTNYTSKCQSQGLPWWHSG